MANIIRSTVVIQGMEEMLEKFWEEATKTGEFSFESVIPCGNDVNLRLKKWGVIATPTDISCHRDMGMLEMTWHTMRSPADEFWCAVSKEYGFIILTEFEDATDPENEEHIGFFWIRKGDMLRINQPLE